MENKEKLENQRVREYSLELAFKLLVLRKEDSLADPDYEAQEVIEAAKELEAYIIGDG